MTLKTLISSFSPTHPTLAPAPAADKAPQQGGSVSRQTQANPFLERDLMLELSVGPLRQDAPVSAADLELLERELRDTKLDTKHDEAVALLRRRSPLALGEG